MSAESSSKRVSNRCIIILITLFLLITGLIYSSSRQQQRQTSFLSLSAVFSSSSSSPEGTKPTSYQDHHENVLQNSASSLSSSPSSLSPHRLKSLLELNGPNHNFFFDKTISLDEAPNETTAGGGTALSKNLINFDAGQCYPESESVDWSPTNCPDDAKWLELWLKERSKILHHRYLHKQSQQQQQSSSSISNGTEIRTGDLHSSRSSRGTVSIAHPYESLEKWLLIDVGANKGFTLFRWLESLIGASRLERLNTFTISQEAVKMKSDRKDSEDDDARLRETATDICGACCDCTEEALDYSSTEEFDRVSPVGRQLRSLVENGKARSSSSNSIAPIRIVGLEPVLANYNFVKKLIKSGINNNNSSSSSSSSSSATVASPFNRTKDIEFDIRLNAASKTSAHGVKVPFRTGPFGVETLSFKNKKAKGHVSVKHVRIAALEKLILDEPNSPYKDSYIDYFTTDTEGFDVDVWSGAERLFRANRIKLYVFEMHQKADYRLVFTKMKSWNYECYYPPQPTARGVTKQLPYLIRITGECFTPRLGRLRGWMNAVCVNKVSAPELVNIFGWLTTQTRKIKVTCGLPEERDEQITKVMHWLKKGKRG